MRTLLPRRAPQTLVGLAVLCVLTLAAACGSEQDTGLVPRSPAPEPKHTTKLVVTVQASPDDPAKTFTLTCDPAGGDHPDADKACAALAKAKKPFAPTPKDMACTEIYGGDQTATVKGAWRGQPVDASFSRANGCEIARWDAIAVVFPVKVGA